MRRQIEVSSLLLSDQTQSETGKGETQTHEHGHEQVWAKHPPGAHVLMEEIKKQKSGRLVRERETEKGGEEEERVG